MKRVMMIAFVLIAFSGFSQTVQTKAIVREQRIAVTYNKTTNVVFPAAITSVDRGSQDILVQQAPGADNVLRVKADVKGFAETNLSVSTADGQLFSFLVSYAENPLELNITIAGDQGASTLNNASSVTLTDNAARIRSKRGNIHSVHDRRSKVSLALKGFYVKGNTIFCKLHMENDSRIDYDIDQFRFYVRDKKKARRTASKEVKLTRIPII